MIDLRMWWIILLGFLLVALVALLVGVWRNRRKVIRHADRAQAKSDRLEEQLVQAQHFEAVGIMAGSIVHNLNNLMSVILGHTRMVAHDLPSQSPVQKDLQHILKAGHMAADLLNEISDFNRQAEHALKPTDLSSLLGDTLKFLRDILPSSIQIQEDFPPQCEPVMASATGVQQVLMNLISNSVKAIGESPGLIEVQLSDCTVERWHQASPQDLGPGSYIKLTIRDNGQGMDSATLDRIIGAYFESPPDTTRLGLGLNTVFRILDEHDGVSIPTSEAGKGTSFDIYFPKIAWRVVSSSPPIAVTIPEPKQIPVADHHPAHQQATVTELNAKRPSHQPTAGEERATILLVDDEEMVARVTAIGLQKLGYRVIKHLDSRKALADFVQTPEIFDAVITDQIMPHMSGVHLARKIHDVRPDIPVILMTGFRDSFTENQSLDAAISQIVLKPTSHRDLAEVIEKVRLRRRESHF